MSPSRNDKQNWFFLKNPNWVLIKSFMISDWWSVKQQLAHNSNTFSDWGRACHVSWVKTHLLQRESKTRDLSFLPASDQVVHLETAANLCASRRQENIFFEFVCWVGRQNRILNDWPRGKHSDLVPFDPHCFPRRKQWVLFPLDPQCSLRNVNQKKSKLYQMLWY